jgi:toxin ParE1/3/4
VFRTTPDADADLIGIYEYGALKFGVAQAERYLEGFHNVFQFLSASPYASRERTEVEPPVRIWPFQARMIIYRIVDEDVLVLRVLGMRQDWYRHLEP